MSNYYNASVLCYIKKYIKKTHPQYDTYSPELKSITVDCAREWAVARIEVIKEIKYKNSIKLDAERCQLKTIRGLNIFGIINLFFILKLNGVCEAISYLRSKT